MVRDPRAVKRPYRAPAFEVVDANIAQAELEAKAASEDVDVQEMLGVIKRRLERTASISDSRWLRKSRP